MELIKTPSFELAVVTCGNKAFDKLAICLPGRLDTKDYGNFISHIEYLKTKGFYALAFDPPGTWDSPGNFAFTTTSYIKAVNELIEYFGNKSTLLLGHSRGGQVAQVVGTLNPAVKAIVLINASFGPPSLPDPKDVHNNTFVELRDLPPGTSETEKQRKFLLSMNYFKDAEKYDPLPVLRSWVNPKLIIYGVNDPFYSPREVKEIFDSLGEPKMLYEINTDHEYRYVPEAIEEVNVVIGQFLDKYPWKL